MVVDYPESSNAAARGHGLKFEVKNVSGCVDFGGLMR